MVFGSLKMHLHNVKRRMFSANSNADLRYTVGFSFFPWDTVDLHQQVAHKDAMYSQICGLFIGAAVGPKLTIICQFENILTHLLHICTTARNMDCFRIGRLWLWKCVQWFAGIKVKVQVFHTKCVCLLPFSMAVGFVFSGAEAELRCTLVVAQNSSYLKMLEKSCFFLLCCGKDKQKNIHWGLLDFFSHNKNHNRENNQINSL